VLAGTLPARNRDAIARASVLFPDREHPPIRIKERLAAARSIDCRRRSNRSSIESSSIGRERPLCSPRCTLAILGHRFNECEVMNPAEWRQHRFALTAVAHERLRQEAVWVTGAGTGFGQAVAVALALCGARVILTGRRTQNLAKTVDAARSLGAAADQFVILPMDVSAAAALEAAESQLTAEAVTGLVHCAGIPQRHVPGGPLLASEDLHALWQTNVVGAWHCLRAVVRVAAPRGRVRAVLFSSEAAWHFTEGFGPYNVSKAAVNSLAGSMAEEATAQYPDADVQINVLNPGEARTEMNQGSEVSPYAAAPMVLALMSQPRGGPNGFFFHADGTNLTFGARAAWPTRLLADLHATGAPPRLVGAVQGYNVVEYRGMFFGIPQSLGELRLDTCGALPDGAVVADSFDAVTDAIHRRAGTSPCG